MEKDVSVNASSPARGAAFKTDSLRGVMADSHVGCLIIAVLFLWSLDWGFQAMWIPLARIASYIFTAVAILDIPSFNFRLDRLMLYLALGYLYAALSSFTGAYVVSRWVYGCGPLRSLTDCADKIIKGRHV